MPKPASPVDSHDDPLLSGLNSSQLAAVTHENGPLLVVAGAGSGKTRVLTHRIAYLVARCGVHPSKILAITFTNRAADEVRRRVDAAVGDGSRGMWVLTFHSACLRILRSHADRLGYKRSFTIYDDSDSRRLVEYVLDDLGLDSRRLPARSVLGAISQAKAELVDFETYASQAHDLLERRIALVYKEYQSRLLAANAMDFDDLIMVTVNLMQACEDVLAFYQQRFTHILVDEYQDTNRAQNELVLLLGKKSGNVCVVGDSDQSIYRFRGADISNILEFERAFPQATVVALEQNYRSTQTILDAANAVIANNSRRVPKALWTELSGGAELCLYRATDERDEAEWLGSEAWRLHHSEGLPWADIAVFYRTNAQSRAIEEALSLQGIPYRVVGGTRFYDRREVRDLMAYLRVASNIDDEVSIKRILNVPRRGIGNTSVARISTWAATNSTSFANALVDASSAGVSGRALKGIEEFLDLAFELGDQARRGAAPAVLLELAMERSGYRSWLEAEQTIESEGRLENIGELVGVAAQFEDLAGFLEAISLASDTDTLDERDGQVSLMTLHAAKGLEFPAVFLVGMEDGIFPHSRALDNPSELEEERRLCYVGITRARERLYVSHAWSRVLWGSVQHGIPSRFLREIPPELLREVGPN